jgi:predicted Fe-S protein YdhL (DUF1289 family)
MNIPSPCIQVCKLDDGDVCLGCHRTRDEIARWLKMTDDERARIMAALAERANELEVAHE